MKYLLLDTNIYLDMLVDRRGDVSSELVTIFRRLLDFDEINLIIPSIVEFEVKKHIDEQLRGVAVKIKDAISAVEKVYDICGCSSGGLQAKEHKKHAKKELTVMKEQFRLNQDLYRKELGGLVDDLFKHKNSTIINDDDKIRSLCMKRKIYKRAPFHIDGKDSFADGTILEILLNLSDYFTVESGSTVIFVTGNTTDFSDKDNKDEFHNHIIEDIAEKKLDYTIDYVTKFSRLVGKYLKEEVENANLKDEFLKELRVQEEIQEKQFFDDYQDSVRASFGLSSLQHFDSYFLQSYRDSDFACKTADCFSIVNRCYDLIEELLGRYDGLIARYRYIGASELQDFIRAWNSISDEINVPEIEFLGNIVEVCDYLQEKIRMLGCYQEAKKLEDYLEYGETRSFLVKDGEWYQLETDDLFLDCRDGDWDDLEIWLVKKQEDGECSEVIAEGSVRVSYGYGNFDEDGNVADACEESIEYFTVAIENELMRVVNEFEEWVKNEMKIVETLEDVLHN